MKRFKYSIKEIGNLLARMTILIDAREKSNEHITDHLTQIKMPYEVTTLNYGDYSCKIEISQGEYAYFHDSIVIERKGSLEELSGNFTRDRERFEKEFLRAGNDGAKIYLMVEDVGGYSSIIGHLYGTELKSNAYIASLKAWEARYNLNVQFVDKQYAGYVILSTLQYFVREALK